MLILKNVKTQSQVMDVHQKGKKGSGGREIRLSLSALMLPFVLQRFLINY